MIDVLDALQLQTDKTLIPTSESFRRRIALAYDALCLRFSILRGILELRSVVTLCVIVISSGSTESCDDSAVEEGVGSAAWGRRILTRLLRVEGLAGVQCLSWSSWSSSGLLHIRFSMAGPPGMPVWRTF